MGRGTARLAGISIHALRKESDAVDDDPGGSDDISIHALRKESDLQHNLLRDPRNAISIHALRKESDLEIVDLGVPAEDFNPRSP